MAIPPPTTMNFLENVWFDSESEPIHRLDKKSRVWGNELSIHAIGGMSDEAKFIQIYVSGALQFERDLLYLSRLWPQPHKLKVYILADRTDQIEIRLIGSEPKMRAAAVLVGVFMQPRQPR